MFAFCHYSTINFIFPHSEDGSFHTVPLNFPEAEKGRSAKTMDSTTAWPALNSFSLSLPQIIQDVSWLSGYLLRIRKFLGFPVVTSAVDHPQGSTVLLWGRGFRVLGWAAATGTKSTASNLDPLGLLLPGSICSSQRALVSCRFSLTAVSSRQVPQEHQGLLRWHWLLVFTQWSSV